jgi:hypothetical protein
LKKKEKKNTEFQDLKPKPAWAEVKNKSLTMAKEVALVNEETGRLIQTFWAPCILHPENLQKVDCSKETGCDEILQPIIISSQDCQRAHRK